MVCFLSGYWGAFYTREDDADVNSNVARSDGEYLRSLYWFGPLHCID